MGRLTELYVQDFKSYKGSQVIGPFLNFTAVIGPNGSGKSNLMDAISFVLGIKSSQLRSSQLSELIYRPPSGNELPPSKASVTALYEKEDKTVIRFTRTISSAGVSEYKIDGIVISYAKYNRALESEHILVKARNFLIFQGDVEAIASQSPKDLTRYFEQISGSLELKEEYDRLKEVLEKATEQSAFNFTKKRGIHAEMKQFKEQKEEAERYEKLIVQKNELIISHLLWRLFHNQRESETLSQDILKEKQQMTGFSTSEDTFNKKLKEFKINHGKVLKNQLRLEKKLRDKDTELSTLHSTRLGIDEKVKYASKKLAQAQQNTESTRAQMKIKASEVKALEKETDQVKKAFLSFEDQLKQKAEKAGLHFSPSAQKEYTALKTLFESNTNEDQENLSRLDQEYKAKSESKHRLQEKLNSIQAKKESLDQEKSLLKKRHSVVSEIVAQLETKIIETRTQLSEIESEKRTSAHKETELHEKLTDVQNRIMQARVDSSTSEREAKFSECLGNMKRAFEGVHGRMLDLCKPGQRKYDLAVQIILGKNLDAVIVDTEKTAIECIQYMRDQRAGQATFIPLDTISMKPVHEKYRQIAKGARLAIDVVTFEPFYEKAVTYCCGNALICDDANVAKYIMYEKREEVKCVTVDGTVFHKTGMITGGQGNQGKGGSRRWDEKDVENLKKVRDGLLAQIGEISKTRKRAVNEDQLKSEITTSDATLRIHQDDLNNIEGKLNSIRTEMNHLTTESDALLPTFTELDACIQVQAQALEKVKSSLHTLQDAHFSSFCALHNLSNIRDYEEEHSSFSQESIEKRLEFETTIAKLENLISFERESFDGLKLRMETFTDLIAKEEEILQDLDVEKNKSDESDSKLQSATEEIRKQLEICNSEMEILVGSVQETKKELNALHKAFEKQNKLVTTKESRIEELVGEKFSILRRCKLEDIALPLEEGSLEDFSLDTGDTDTMEVDGMTRMQVAMQEYVPNYKKLTRTQKENGAEEMDYDFQENIKTLMNELDRIAPNMKAIEKLDEVEAKLRETAEEFDATRREAKEAKDEFNKIKQERYSRFFSAYSHISECIDSIYKKLTKSKVFPLGGTAYLSLEDSEEPYNEGVKYHAMPPMKRFRDMEQLSGGEKTVAALALMFAIHSFKPAPFFILDEVDSALDNTNVAKVANYVREHASDTFQFIVISLKSSFYEKAGGLCGIYRDKASNGSQCLTLQLDGRFD